MRIAANVLDAIGNTPLVQLHRVVPPGCARVLVKLEGANPTGNMKDRMAKAAIEAAEASGRLRPGDTVRASASASFRPCGIRLRSTRSWRIPRRRRIGCAAAWRGTKASSEVRHPVST